MATQAPLVVVVFEQESQATCALDALRQSGFRSDQVGFAAQRRGNVNLLREMQNLGISRKSASYYDQEYKAGRIIVSVSPEGREQEARNLLYSYGGYDDERRATSAQNIESNQADEFHEPRSLKLREERLNVTKEQVQSGEVSLRKETVTEQKTINVPVMHEEVVIERHAISGGPPDTVPIGEGETIRIPVSEEQVNVSKQNVVTGEVTIGKRAVEETRRVSDTVKREEAYTECEGDVRMQGSLDVQNTGREDLPHS